MWVRWQVFIMPVVNLNGMVVVRFLKRRNFCSKNKQFSRPLDTCWLPYTMVMGVMMVNMTQPVSVCKSDMQ